MVAHISCLRFPLSEKSIKENTQFDQHKKWIWHQRNKRPRLLLLLSSKVTWSFWRFVKIYSSLPFFSKGSKKPFQVLGRNQHVKKIFFVVYNAQKQITHKWVLNTHTLLKRYSFKKTCSPSFSKFKT
jgi:hypothetical protein